jgi:hypothetical protein
MMNSDLTMHCELCEMARGVQKTLLLLSVVARRTVLAVVFLSACAIPRAPAALLLADTVCMGASASAEYCCFPK